MPIQTPLKREKFQSTLKTLVLGVLLGVIGIVIVTGVHPQKAHAATAGTINFQAKLQTAAGSIAPDGFYNVEFKLYDATSTNVWTEDRLYNNGPGSSDIRVQVVNGYLTVNLGQYTPFGGTINWDQDLTLGDDSTRYR